MGNPGVGGSGGLKRPVVTVGMTSIFTFPILPAFISSAVLAERMYQQESVPIALGMFGPLST